MIGDNIKKIRKSKGYTQQGLADLAKISRTYLADIESNRYSGSVETLNNIATALNISITAIMSDNDNSSNNFDDKFPPPNITEDYTTFPVMGEIAAGYDHIAIEEWDGEKVDIPNVYLKGHNKTDFFVLNVKGDSMFPAYMDGDKVLILKQSTMNYSGQIGAILYGDECATLKKVEYCNGEDWMRLVPINPNCPPIKIESSELEHCRVIGIPKLLLREIN